MKTILILSNHHSYTYNLRKEVIKKFIDLNYRVILVLPYGEKIDLLKDMGCEFIDVDLDRRGTNLICDFKLLLAYNRILKKFKPEIVLTYTLKPNLYGGIACRLNSINSLHTVTGLGSVFVRNVKFKRLVIFLNKIAFRNANMIVFMNSDNERLYRELGIISQTQNTRIVPGSGVNLDIFKFQEYPKRKNVKFTFIARILKDKGIEEFILAAKKIKKLYTETEFEVVGFVDEDKYKTVLSNLHRKKIITYLGPRNDIPDIIASSSCIVLPSYGEGRGTVLQEGASIGRPLITCDTYGCRDNVDDGENGFLCKVADSQSLFNAMLKFLTLSDYEKKQFGMKSRQKAVQEFDRNIVVKAYVDIIKNILIKG